MGVITQDVCTADHYPPLPQCLGTPVSRTALLSVRAMPLTAYDRLETTPIPVDDILHHGSVSQSRDLIDLLH